MDRSRKAAGLAAAADSLDARRYLGQHVGARTDAAVDGAALVAHSR